MEDSSIAPPLRLARRAPTSQPQARLFIRFKSRLRQLDRVRQLILFGLAIMGIVIIGATTAYALIPAKSAVAAAQPAVMTPAPSHLTGNPPVAGQPAIAGHYLLSDVSTNPLALDVQVFGANVTGTLTTQGCSGQAATAVVTGHFVTATSLMLTVAQPNVAHATTVLYTFTHTDNGFSLAWRDDAGQAQVQHWTATTRTNNASTCQLVP